MVKYLYDIGCRCFHAQAYYKSQEKHNDELFPTKYQYENLNEEMQKLKNTYKDMEFILGYEMELIRGDKSYRAMTRPYCLGGRRGMSVYSNGDFGMCGMTFNQLMRIGNVRTVGLRKAWESKEMIEMIKPRKEKFVDTMCYDCDSFEECGEKRCYLRSVMYYGTPYQIDPMCKYSESDYKYTCD